MPESPAYVGTSWDDGAIEDLRLAELLAKHRIPGCFYVPKANPERPVMSERQLRELATGFEVGAHGMSHLRLTQLPLATAVSEIRECKSWMEDVTGRSVRSFCYPGGKYTTKHMRAVEQAGFSGARTAEWLSLELGASPYEMAPSLHVYPHSFAVNVGHCVRRRQTRRLLSYLSDLRCATRPLALAGRMLEQIARHGGVFHLWGHSWEIEQLDLWTELENILALIADFPELTRIDNAELALRARGNASMSKTKDIELQIEFPVGRRRNERR